MDIQTSEELDAFFSVPDPWRYDEAPDDARRVEHILAALPEGVPERVLDVGCGGGFLTTRLPGRHVTGVDLSPAAVRWARARADRLGRPDIAFRVCSVMDLDDLPAHGFDLVVVTGVLYRQYIGNAFTAAAGAVLRRLAPGGILLHAHIEAWFPHAFPLDRIAAKTYPYRDYMHRLEVYRT